MKKDQTSITVHGPSSHNNINSIKILCTGNPSEPTIAKSVKKIFNTINVDNIICTYKTYNVDFASRTYGYDLRMYDKESENHFRHSLKKYNVLINASFIHNGGQMQILNTTYDEWQKGNIKNMHVFNIGSITEYTGRSSKFGMYGIDKRALKERSLQLVYMAKWKSKEIGGSFKSTHLTLGGLNDGKSGNENQLDMTYIAETIDWILRRPFDVPLISVE